VVGISNKRLSLRRCWLLLLSVGRGSGSVRLLLLLSTTAAAALVGAVAVVVVHTVVRVAASVVAVDNLRSEARSCCTLCLVVAVVVAAAAVDCQAGRAVVDAADALSRSPINQKSKTRHLEGKQLTNSQETQMTGTPSNDKEHKRKDLQVRCQMFELRDDGGL
jgi:hypothetical protein